MVLDLTKVATDGNFTSDTPGLRVCYDPEGRGPRLPLWHAP